MLPPVLDPREKLDSFSDLWAPRVIGDFNDSHIKVAKIQGDFVWHAHEATDELFLVVRGTLDIDFRDGTQTLSEGQMLVVPRGVEHRPRAVEECHILLIELAGTVNTGNAGGELTAKPTNRI